MNIQVQFYRDMLGLSVKFPSSTTDYSNEYWVEFETGSCSLVLHGGGNKIIGQDAPKLAFSVDDIVSFRNRLIELGINMGDIRSPAPGVQVADGIDPEGNKFSIDAH